MDLTETLKVMMAEAEKYDSCMALDVSEAGKAVELWLDTSLDTYTEHIKNEGADIGLMRCRKTDRVVGVRLPLLCRNLCVHHDGPIRINAGFLKSDRP